MTRRIGRPFEPGKSGNPKGRPNSSASVAHLRSAIAKHVPEIVTQMVEKAKAGDAAAARLLLERVLPPVKAAEQPVQVELPDGPLADQGRAVLAAAGAGVVAPSQAAQLLTALSAVAKLIETDELAARLSALEERLAKT